LSAGIALPSAALAQDAGEETVIVTGIRASLERAMDIKRNADGVVDAISAEDIGDFPDTNLAESLQRISGVSINRVNGEGSEVTVRGFGAGFNMVTLNGRVMPTANVTTVGGDQSADTVTGTTRAFDFSNLASEGVNGLQVYKTGRADIASGGIGASINIQTARPLDNPGMRGTVGVKLAHDSGVDRGDQFTPEVSGLFNWTDPSERLGVSLFGSFQERDGSTRSGTVNGWNIVPYSQFEAERVTATGTVTNAPTDPGTLVAFPNDTRYHLAETHRERVNGQLTAQFRPVDTLTLTADYTYARNQTEEQRTDQTNWFNQGFDEVIFDQNQVVPTTVFLQQDINGVKDIGFEQQYRGTEDTLTDFGFNAEWLVTDNFTLSFDAHTAKAESLPNNPMGVSSTLLGIGGNVITDHAMDLRSGFPQQLFEPDDTLRGNANGVLDVGDLGATIARTVSSAQTQELDQYRVDGQLDFGSGARVDFGVDYRTSEMTRSRVQTQQTLGNWGASNVGDIEQFAPGVLEEYCLSCLYNDVSPGNAEVAFRGNAVTLYQALSEAYLTDPFNDGNDHSVTINQDQYDEVSEDVWASYVQLSLQGDFMGRPSRLLAGVRYEETEIDALSNVPPPLNIIWTGDQDFLRPVSNQQVAVSSTGQYNHVLPNFDFSVDLADDLVGRVSFSKTIARAGFGSLFAATDVTGNPARPTVFGGAPTGTSGSPGLLPLESENFDVSLEWYYGDANFISAGYYRKDVSNFEGTSQTTLPLFEMRDPTSAQPGTRSGDARQALEDIGANFNERNLFTMTALYDNYIQMGDPDPIGHAIADFEANRVGNDIEFDFADTVETLYDVIGDATDPLYQVEVTQPVNAQEAQIYGFEIAGQHFFGDTGFGVAGSLTTVEGDVEYDISVVDVDQFALVGLSNTYNVSLIYENYGVSARLTYNWRDNFLDAANRTNDSYRNPSFTDEFGQVDLSINYDLNDRVVLSFEGINLTDESFKTYNRSPAQVWMVQELDARYLFGARYKFN
jgi:TonB-dependent receptor